VKSKKKIKTLVIGGSGFLGSHVADLLSKRNHKVTIFDKRKYKFLNKNQKFIKGDILNYAKIRQVMKGQDIVFMFAGLSNLNEAIKKPIEAIKYNILATANVLENCAEFNIKRFIFSSSVYANSNIGGFYRASKLAAEEFIKEYSKSFKVKFTVLRYGSLYGPRSDSSNGVKNIILYALKYNKLRYIGSSLAERQYIHISDATEATLSILKKKYENKFVTIKGKKNIKVKKLLSYLKNKLNIKKNIRFDNKKFSGHYIKFPKKYSINLGQNFKFNKNKDIFQELDKLILMTQNELQKK